MLLYFTRFSVTAPGSSALVIALLALFWMMGLGFAVRALRLPRVRVEISAVGVALLWKHRP